LSQRINVAEAESELGKLAAVLNSTFARLESAFAQQKQFASDAAHELRTPVAVILTQTLTALNRERDAASYKETVEACQRAAQRMRKLRVPTITGGLTFGGGPGNNYVTHSIASMVDALRADPNGQGLVTALGWFCTKHSWGVYASAPPKEGFRYSNPQGDVDRQARCESDQRDGPATVESYTVTHASYGEPERLIIAARTSDNVRTWCHSTDAALMRTAETQELIGRTGEITNDVFEL
jgi:hypothetical protein